MDDSLYYLAVNRQRGLTTELTTIANNLANIDTSGYRREGLVFSEFVIGREGAQSLSMADLNARFASSQPGSLRITDAPLDLAIEGEGFFAIAEEDGIRLTRAGRFQRAPDGLLVMADGKPVLDAGEAPIFVPPEGQIAISEDGTLSVGGVEQARVGVFALPPEGATRMGETGFLAAGPPVPIPEPKIRQGAIEGSNVDAVLEIARMIEVSRAYEQVQGLVQDEDDRIREAIDRLGQPA